MRARTRRTASSILAIVDEAAVERLRQALAIGIRHHVDVDAGIERQRRGLDEIGRDAVLDQFGDRRCSR